MKHWIFTRSRFAYKGFPQFAIALNIIEDFLVGEDMKFLRLVSFNPLNQLTRCLNVCHRMATHLNARDRRIWTHSTDPIPNTSYTFFQPELEVRELPLPLSSREVDI